MEMNSENGTVHRDPVKIEVQQDPPAVIKEYQVFLLTTEMTTPKERFSLAVISPPARETTRSIFSAIFSTQRKVKRFSGAILSRRARTSLKPHQQSLR